jgi:hypothetical protein
MFIIIISENLELLERGELKKDNGSTPSQVSFIDKQLTYQI